MEIIRNLKVNHTKIEEDVENDGYSKTAEKAGYTLEHPDWQLAAGILEVLDIQKKVGKYRESVEKMRDILDEKYYEFVMENMEEIEKKLEKERERDYRYDYFAITTLKKGYMCTFDNQILETPQYMWMRVACHTHCGDLTAAFETYDAYTQGYCIPASPTIANSGFKKSQGSSCFLQGTEVFTMNNGIKNIEDVKIGDMVVTHNGNIKSVTQLHKNELGERKIYELKCQKTPNVYVTDNHKFWSIKKDGVPAWNSIDKLCKGDYIALPKVKQNIKFLSKIDLKEIIPLLAYDNEERCCEYEYEYDEEYITMTTVYQTKDHLNKTEEFITRRIKSKPIKRYLEITPQFAKFLGIWYGDGCISHTKTTNGGKVPSSLQIVSHKNNVRLIEFCQQQFQEIFGELPNINQHNDIVNLTYHSSLMSKIFAYLFGSGFHFKFINPLIFSWDLDLIYNLCLGLISTDGCIRSEGSIFLTMSNINFMKTLYHLCRQHGVDVSYTQEKQLRKGATELSATIFFPRSFIQMDQIYKYYNDDRIKIIETKPILNKYVKIVNDVTFIRIKSNTETDINTKFVYTLGVEDDHSYNVEGLVCENCFMLSLDDSLESILDNYKLCGMISKYKGGLGIGVGRIRHSKIGRTGMSKGIVDMLRCYNELMRYVDQEGMRKGAATVFYPAWGKDIRSLIEMKKNHGKEELRARDLNYCVWIQDLFMKRVILNQNWTLFCPNLAPGLNDCYGEEFEKLYTSYENDPTVEKFTMSARQLLEEICRAQKESSAPFVMFDDAVNMKCNQGHLGHITNSNLCLEVTLFNKPDELVASCNLSTIVLDSYVEYDENNKPYFNYDKLKIYVKLLVRNINNIINKNFYVSDLIKRSNDLYAPLGIGKLGVANLAAKLNLDFDSEEFIVLMETVCACMYHSALQESRDIAIKKEKLASDDEKLLYKHNLDLFNQGLGPRPDPIGSFSSFSQSPIGNGLFQFDLWKLEDEKFRSYPLGSLYDKIKRTETLIPASAFYSDESWDQLRLSILTHGVANSTLMCGMPNATTAQIVPNNILGRMVRRNESHEPFHTNLYLREVLSGAFPVYTCELVSDLESLGLWNKSTLNFLMKNKGSVKGLSLLFPDIPSVVSIEQKYRTGFELSQKRLIELVARMGRYICMSQSHNIRLEDPDVNQLFNLHIYSWLMGQKTGMYYLHQRSAVDRQQFTLSDLPSSSLATPPTPVSSPSTISPSSLTSPPLYTDPSLTSEERALASMICRRDNPDCASCQ